jgi:2Fe-2S ferredoxin
MPTVHFEGNIFGEDSVAEVPGGGALVDVCDKTAAPVPFSCRSATCGTCRVEVLQGADLFETPEPEEAELLEILGDPSHFRLACQAKLRSGNGIVRLRINDDEL